MYDKIQILSGSGNWSAVQSLGRRLVPLVSGRALTRRCAIVEPTLARTVIIGDIHGCLLELDALLDTIGLNSSDRVVCVGDVIGRGPRSIGVLDRLMSMGAQSVQGNHELHLLQRVKADADGWRTELGSHPHWQFATELGDQHLEWLQGLPLYCAMPKHELVVVHAGVQLGMSLEAQDPWVLTHIRSFDADGRPSSALGSAAWATQYPGPQHVVFGHAAQRELQLHPHATGLDTGCVYGKRLTAMVLNEGAHVPGIEARESVLVSVPALQPYSAIKS